MSETLHRIELAWRNRSIQRCYTQVSDLLLFVPRSIDGNNKNCAEYVYFNVAAKILNTQVCLRCDNLVPDQETSF